MQTVLTKYWLAIHVGVLLVASWCWLFTPGFHGHVPMLWLSVMVVEALLLLPSVRRGETLFDARKRVVGSVVWDPFFYFGLALLGFAVAQLVNCNSTLVYASDADVWQFSAPRVAWIPSGVDAVASLSAVVVFTSCLTGCVVLRQGVSKVGKRYLLQAVSSCSGLVAFVAVFQACSGVEPYGSLALSPGACNAGSLFGFWLILGMGAFVDALARQQRGVEPLFLFAFVGNLLGMLFFATGVAALVFSGVTLLLFLYWIIYLHAASQRVVQLKLCLLTVMVLVSVSAGLTVVFPKNPVAEKVRAVFVAETYWSGLRATKAVRSAAAISVWGKHPWAGVGAGGFRHHVGTVVEGGGWKFIKADPACVYNDGLRFLCEYGALGVGLMLALVVTLLVPLLYRTRLAWSTGGTGDDHNRTFLFRLSPVVVTGALAAQLALLESFVGDPFQLPALFLSWMCVMASLPAFLPAKKQAVASA